ncbi:hypothetical protein LZ32DRAFT_595435 [Colletotrichum eremochloae]|nr:hypothetical protein LZ32DRAFT_595435 [Colletotrichum eremochloae]
MPIGDLLAQISGDKSQSTSPAPSRPLIPPPKRKADDDLRSTVSNKTPRTSANGIASSAPSKSTDAQRPARPTEKPATTTTGYRGSAGRPPDRSTSAPKLVGNGSTAAKPSSSGARPLNGSSTSKVTSTLPTRPSPSVPSAAPKSGAPPKKGSFAEIMARAQQAQTKMGQVGKIQHKPVEKVFAKKEREDIKKDAKKDPKAAARQPSKFQGNARPSAAAAPTRNGTGANRNAAVDKAKDPRSATKAHTAVTDEENQKKLKKAAIATTGYTGTARPKPGAASAKKKAAPGGALLNARPAPRYGGSAKRSRYDDDEEDEELDDFIEYDEDEEEVGPRYTYDSDGSSDMEAGMDDVWEEEAKAERVARLEDIEQERLEKRLKAEKEERKRRFYEQQKARR